MHYFWQRILKIVINLLFLTEAKNITYFVGGKDKKVKAPILKRSQENYNSDRPDWSTKRVKE